MDTHDQTATDLCRQIVWTAAQFRRESEKAFSDAGLIIPHVHVLQQLDSCGPMPLSEVGKKLWISGPNVTGLIDKLVQKGLVRRVRQRKDRRVILAEITEKGTGVLRDLMPTHSDLVSRFVSGLSTKDVSTMQKLLGKLRESLEPGLAGQHDRGGQ